MWGYAFGMFRCNQQLSTRWKHAEGMSLRYNRTYFLLNRNAAPIFLWIKKLLRRVGGWVEPVGSEQFVWGYCGVGGLLFVTSNFCGDFGDLGVVEATVEAFSPYANGIYWHITGRM